ncbi:MAG: hypothetical protein KIG70_06790 [Treponema sp.]|uniref:hypothetical protein n=1 Tax=Treponema sp. TaxID=166 RepID=UPI001D77292A|nr:hypothetical protein [Treponema sp.]MBS7310877.1 hypothetical protein [Treponema sp.]
MENAKVICETDADILLEFVQLKDSGFLFKYEKTENGLTQNYVNCNGSVYGPFDSVYLESNHTDEGEWTAYEGEFELKFEHNGKACKKEKMEKIEGGKKGGNEVLSQDEIDQLLTAIAEGEANAPEEEYYEKTHVLRLNRKHQEFFVTDKKKYGPYYAIENAQYKNEENFQFICHKRKDFKNWYYNFNGKEIGPFQGSHLNCYYDAQNRAIVDNLGNYNFILVDGKKVKCFSGKYHYCNIYEENGHKIVVGSDSNDQLHFKRDGILQDFEVRSVCGLDSGDVVYCRKLADREVWFYNDQQISIPVNGYDSTIYETLLSYKRNGIHYFSLRNSEYNGMLIDEFDIGFVYLENLAIRFLPWDILTFHRVLEESISNERYKRYREGNYLSLYNTNRLAGRD